MWMTGSERRESTGRPEAHVDMTWGENKINVIGFKELEMERGGVKYVFLNVLKYVL